MSDIQVVLVSKRSEQKQEESMSDLQRKVTEIKLTNNLIKEISFNSTINRFQYLEQLLRKEHDQFIATVTQAINKQKQVIKQMKNLQRQIKQLKMPNINFNRITAQSQELVKLKQQSDKNSKLSSGMLMALGKIQKQLDNYEQKGSSSGKEKEDDGILM